MATEQELFVNEVPLQECSCQPSPCSATWERINQSISLSNPPSRGGHSSIYIPNTAPNFGHSLLSFGGANREAVAFNDIHRFDLETKEWSLIDCMNRPPPARSGHTCVLIDDQSLLIHGGQSVELPTSEIQEPIIHLFDDVWKFDLNNSTWTQISINQSIKRNCATAVVQNGSMCVIGGSDETGPCSTIHQLELSISQSSNSLIGTWRLISGTGDERDPREMHALISRSNDSWLTCGGRSQLGVLNSIYSINQSMNQSINQWKLLGQASPRCGHSLHTFNSEIAFIYGGIDGLTFYNDVTTFTLSKGSVIACSQCGGPQGWHRINGGPKTDQSEVLSTLPAHRFAHSMTAITTSIQKQFVLHGGMNDERDLNDTWILTVTHAQTR